LKKILLFILFMSFTAQSVADCTLKKAAVNKALDAKTGISGSCDKTKAIESKTDKVAKAKKVRELKKERDARKEAIPEQAPRKSENIKNKISENNKKKAE